MILWVKKSAEALASVFGDSLEGHILPGVLYSILFTSSKQYFFIIPVLIDHVRLEGHFGL